MTRNASTCHMYKGGKCFPHIHICTLHTIICIIQVGMEDNYLSCTHLIRTHIATER